MSEPIIETDTVVTARETVERRYTYEQLLESFPPECPGVVRPLVLRCQAHEAEIERLRDLLAECGPALAGDIGQWHKLRQAVVGEAAVRAADKAIAAGVDLLERVERELGRE